MSSIWALGLQFCKWFVEPTSFLLQSGRNIDKTHYTVIRVRSYTYRWRSFFHTWLVVNSFSLLNGQHSPKLRRISCCISVELEYSRSDINKCELSWIWTLLYHFLDSFEGLLHPLNEHYWCILIVCMTWNKGEWRGTCIHLWDICIEKMWIGKILLRGISDPWIHRSRRSRKRRLLTMMWETSIKTRYISITS